MDLNREKEFQDNVRKYEEAYGHFHRRYLSYSWLRVLVFLFTIGGISVFIYYDQHGIAAVTAIIGIVAFGTLVNLHGKVAFARQQRRILRDLNEEEVDRLKGDLTGFEQGAKYFDPHHDFTADLDVFGSNSLFQLINRTSTPTGQAKLAEWMRQPATADIIRARQQAIEEFKTYPEWNQHFMAFPRHKDHGLDSLELEVFLQWSRGEARPGWTTGRIVGLLLGLINLAILVAVMIGYLQFTFIFLPMVIGIIVVRDLQHELNNAMEVSRVGLHLLETYTLLTTALKEVEWQSPLVRQHLKSLEEPVSALAEINQLKKLFHALSSRANPLFALFNIYFIVDVHLLASLERWKSRNSQHLPVWVEALSELEALSGMAAYAYANPSYTVPEILEEPYAINATGLGHPLIPTHIRVSNDFELVGKGSIGVITGSNMSGKSTFLRTVGINLLLAQIGAPVCAAKFKMGPIAIFSSMRTSDNLQESVSSFYAELQRIERLIKALGSGQQVFFLLDEILKGTNTEDRQLGARSLVKQLHDNTCMGLVSTHDIAIGELAGQMKQVINLHFSSDVVDDNLVFDYRLKPGVCQSFNASELMARIGIKLEKK